MSTGQSNGEPLFAAFTTGADALAYRQRTGKGGWVFVSEDGNAFWFSLSFTPSEVMTHQSVRGQNGVLR